jgi:nitrite reductase/ring-hydroxylating ferredoxin subunit
MKEVQIDGEDVCIVNVEGKYYAIGNVCTHDGGPLADGSLENYQVECPWHGSVRTGEVTNPPATRYSILIKYLIHNELNNSVFYTCSPPGMINAMQDMLQNDIKIPKERIKVEEFTGY